MPKFIHAADLHVDSPLLGLDAYEGAPADRIRGASREALGNLVQLALHERVAFVVIAGDVFDTNPLLETALFFRRQMQRLADAGVPVVIVRGNHDHAGIAPRNLTMPPGVTVLPHDSPESVEIPGAGAVVHGRSYPRFDYDKDLTATYPHPATGLLNVGLLHTGLGSVDGVHRDYAPTSPAALSARGYQYWALGHIHKADRHDHGGVFIRFPGNLQGRHIRETGAKGALVIEYEGSSIRSIQERALDVMRWHHVEVDAREAAASGNLEVFIKNRVFDSTAQDREASRLCAVRVTLSGSLPAGSPDLGSSTDLREHLLGEFQAAGGLLWLEKVRLNATRAQADLSVAQDQLVALAADLAGSVEARIELAGELNSLRTMFQKHDPRLADQAAELLPTHPDDMTGAQAEAVLARALELLRTKLR